MARILILPFSNRDRCLQVVEKMVDLAGIEPATSSMPWKSQNRILLTAKALIVG